MTEFVAAGAGFLLAVLWFDLMFDVQALRYRDAGTTLPEEALGSIAGYYRRVTTMASPMNRLVGVVMLATLAALVVQLADGDVPRWAAATSLALTAFAVLVALIHTFPSAVRLGARSDPAAAQSSLARSILRDHLICLAAISALLVVQLAFAR